MNKFNNILILLCVIPIHSLLATSLLCDEVLMPEEEDFAQNDFIDTLTWFEESQENRCPNGAIEPPFKVRFVVKPLDLEQRTIKISLDNENLQKYIKQKRTLGNPTGISPRGKKYQYFLTSSPLKGIVNPKVSLLTKRGRDTLEESSEIITSAESNFTTGKWAYLDYPYPKDTIVTDCDYPAFASVADEIASHIADNNFTTIHQIIPYLIKAFYDNFSRMLPGISFLKNHEVYCIHYSSLALPLVSHLLNHEKFPFKGSIHFLGADALVKGMRYAKEDGHAWNYLRLEDETGTHHIMLDFLHRKYVVANDNTRSLKDMTVQSVDKDEGIIRKTINLKEDALSYDWMRCTKRRSFSSKAIERKYNNKVVRQHIALKLCTQNKTIDAVTTFECN